MKRENKKSIHHILNLLIAVAFTMAFLFPCLLYTSDAADERYVESSDFSLVN